MTKQETYIALSEAVTAAQLIVGTMAMVPTDGPAQQNLSAALKSSLKSTGFMLDAWEAQLRFDGSQSGNVRLARFAPRAAS